MSKEKVYTSWTPESLSNMLTEGRIRCALSSVEFRVKPYATGVNCAKEPPSPSDPWK